MIDATLRADVLERDRHRCRWCGRVGVGVDPHHIRYRRGAVDDTLDNLISLCRRCHELVHGLDRHNPIVKTDAQQLLRTLVATPGTTGMALARTGVTATFPQRLARR